MDYLEEEITGEIIDFNELPDKNSKKALDEMKRFLFKENVRVQHEKIIMEERKKRLEQEELYFQKKLDVLKDAFKQLDIDKRKLEKEKLLIQARKDRLSKAEDEIFYDNHSMYFGGVNSLLSLRKRYKDLLKIYHPDNMCGDTNTIQKINKEYESLRKIFDYNKQA